MPSDRNFDVATVQVSKVSFPRGKTTSSEGGGEDGDAAAAAAADGPENAAGAPREGIQLRFWRHFCKVADGQCR